MALTHSLTAYKCSFKYMERNNPVNTEEIKDKIKNGELPDYSLSDFIYHYINDVSSLAIGKNANRAIQLTEIVSNTHLPSGIIRTHLQPKAGKQGESLTVFEGSTNKEHKYSKDDVALYDYNVFFYENGKSIIAIFHRKSMAGCKGVFLETANETLRCKGLKLEMELIVPLNQSCDLKNATASKVIIQWVETKNKSSDIADDLDNDNKKKKNKKSVIQNLTIDLKSNMNQPVKTIIDNFRNGSIDNNTAFAQIKTEYLGEANRNNYNDALIQFKIGKRILPPVRFGEIENQIGSYNITNSLNMSDFANSLKENADNYYIQITEGRA